MRQSKKHQSGIKIMMTILFVTGLVICGNMHPALALEIRFEEFQSIPTHGASDWKFFTVGNNHYLAVANANDDTVSQAQTESKIYKWNGTRFDEFQSILTNEANDWAFFSINDKSYIVIANVHDSANDTYSINSVIYEWNGTQFDKFQTIPTNSAQGWEYFSIDTDHYLVVANLLTDPPAPDQAPNFNIDSKIYKWNGTRFDEFQAIPTHGATNWQHFTIASDHYLAVANATTDGGTHNINSVIYKWNGTKFDEFQSVPTNGISYWEYFAIDDKHYLAASNWRSNTSFSVDSKIYEWNGTQFGEFQTIPTHGANDWEFFTVGNDHYLAMANSQDNSIFDKNSVIYRWEGANFSEFQTIPTHRAYDWEYFSIDDKHYLIVANRQSGFSPDGPDYDPPLKDTTFNVNSTIYRLITNPPVVTDQAFDVNENSSDGTAVGIISADDPDLSTLTYTITAGNADGIFAVDSGTGQISVADGTQLDYETTSSYELTAEVSDGLYSDTATIAISVGNVNEKPSVSSGTFSVNENSAGGTSLGTVSASDPDSDSLSYSITGGNSGDAFSISSSGLISVSGSLNYESSSAYNLTVQVSDGVNTDTAAVRVNIVNVNEKPAVSSGTFSVNENSAGGTSLGTISASDPDSDSLTYSITSGNTGNTFAINSGSGQLTVADGGQLDYEDTTGYGLTVQVSDGAYSASASVTVNVRNVNEAPVINDQTFAVDENSAADTLLGEIVAADPDSDSLIYTIKQGNTNNVFALNSSTRQLTVNNAAELDYEKNPGPYVLIVEVSDGTYSDTAEITVNIGNVNEKPVANDQTFDVDENSPNGMLIGTVAADDPESNSLTFAIESGNLNNAFAVDSVSGEITVNDSSKLNFEVASGYSFVVQVSDAAGSDLAAISISIRDVAESPVIDDGQLLYVKENSPNETVVGTVNADDPNGDALKFSIAEGNTDDIFAISESGKITVAKGSLLDYESVYMHMLTIRVSDEAQSDEVHEDTAIVSVSVEDENEAPVANAQTFHVAENSADGTLAGTVIANDLESNALTYSIVSGNGNAMFAVNSDTGDVTIADGSSLDYEETKQYTFTLEVSDGDNSTEIPVTINVDNVATPGDIDDNFVIDLRDAIMIFQILVDMTPPENVHKDADAGGDGKIGTDDLVYVLRYLLGIRN